MDAQKARRIQALFQFGDGLVHAVLAAVCDRIREFIQRLKMRDRLEIEESDALADARGDALWILLPLASQ